MDISGCGQVPDPSPVSPGSTKSLPAAAETPSISPTMDQVAPSPTRRCAPYDVVSVPPFEPPGTVATPRARLEAIVLPDGEGDSAYGTIERTSLHPNEYAFYWRANEGRLKSAIQENRPLVAAAKQALSPDDQRAFDRLWRLTANDIGAQAAVQLLLLEGALTAAASTPGQTLLQELNCLADPGTALAPGLDRPSLVCDLMQEIAFPSSIAQRFRGTCTVTAAQTLLATYRPAEYARIVRELAADPPAPVRLAGGGLWHREPGTEAEDDSRRTASSRLFQAAAMESQFPNADYDNAHDTNTFGDGVQLGGGGTGTLATVVQDLLGPGTYVSPRFQTDSGGPAGLAALIRDAAQTNRPTLVAVFKAAPAGEPTRTVAHEILVVGTTETGVRFVNPAGQIETVAMEALTEMVIGAVFVNPDGPGAPAASLAAPLRPLRPAGDGPPSP